MDTPILDFVRRYRESGPVRLHMPGHKGRPLLGPEEMDITEIPGADVLYASQGIIRRSEDNAAALFGSARTVYSTEGSSLCIRAMVYLALQYARMTGRPPVVAAGRNAHKVFVSAAALLGMEVRWLYPSDGNYTILSCPVTPKALDAALGAMAQPPAAVYITSPDYLGGCADIPGLARVCRRYGVLLLVDNAHGAYLRFLPESAHPLDLGADICCDSAHKTLPALTGGAYLHFSPHCPPALAEMAENAMGLFASTSPSYLILESLDYVNQYLADGAADKFTEAAMRVAMLRDTLRRGGWMTCGQEPLKLTVCPKSRGYTGEALAELLRKRGFVCEFSDPDLMVCMFTPETEVTAYSALGEAVQALPALPPVTVLPPSLERPEQVLSPREALLSLREAVPAQESLGRVLAVPTVSCPPAVPIVVCGEQIGPSAVRLFRYYGIETCEVIK